MVQSQHLMQNTKKKKKRYICSSIEYANHYRTKCKQCTNNAAPKTLLPISALLHLYSVSFIFFGFHFLLDYPSYLHFSTPSIIPSLVSDPVDKQSIQVTFYYSILNNAEPRSVHTVTRHWRSSPALEISLILYMRTACFLCSGWIFKMRSTSGNVLLFYIAGKSPAVWWMREAEGRNDCKLQIFFPPFLILALNV